MIQHAILNVFGRHVLVSPVRPLRATITLLFVWLTVASCNSDNVPDAMGTFESNETLISSEVPGKLVYFPSTEGRSVHQGDTLGIIDTVQNALKRVQTRDQISVVLSQVPETDKQLAALQEQLRNATNELGRIKRLHSADAATQQQLDAATTTVAVLERQINAQLSTLNITSNSLATQAKPLLTQIQQIDDLIRRSYIIAPFSGTILNTFAEQYEVITQGHALLEMARLDTLILRAYVTGDQFSKLHLGQRITVKVDDGNGGYRNYVGVLSWISSRAEFTPKSIQTKDERANLVYAVKIRVANDGLLKIGMYGEVEFQ